MSETALPIPGSRSPTSQSHRPTLFLLHWLGGSARTWHWVTPWLSAQFRCVALDLPGFREAAKFTGFSVADMADAVADAVRSEGPARWAIVGHSMGAKVAAVLSRRTEDGDLDLGGLSHLVLLADSPPCPLRTDGLLSRATSGRYRVARLKSPVIEMLSPSIPI